MLIYKTKNSLIFDGNIDVKEQEFSFDLTEKLINLVKKILEQSSTGGFNNDFLLSEINKGGSGSSNKMGFYMIYNQKTKKYYIGSTIKLANRIADYNRNFKNYFFYEKNFDSESKTSYRPIDSKTRLYKSFVSDIKSFNCKSDDFYFIPLILFDMAPDRTSFKNLENLSGYNPAEPFRHYLEMIEFSAIEFFLVNQDSKYAKYIYNTAAQGKFTQNNKARPNTSGSPKKPIAQISTEFEAPLAFESISVCAKYFGVDRKTIRNRFQNKKFRYLDLQEFNSWEAAFKITKDLPRQNI